MRRRTKGWYERPKSSGDPGRAYRVLESQVTLGKTVPTATNRDAPPPGLVAIDKSFLRCRIITASIHAGFAAAACARHADEPANTATHNPSTGDNHDGAESDRGSGSVTATGPGVHGDTSSSDGPQPPGDCTPGTLTCANDGYAQLACGWDPQQQGNTWGWRVPCGDGEACVAGECASESCGDAELLFVVDRSDSMLEGGRWDWVSATLAEFGTESGQGAQQGLRMFPAGPCEPGRIAPIERRPAGFGALLDPPTTGASTPIHAALDDLAPAFGDPDQRQAVILVTDGDETCDLESSPALAASNLFRLGIRVYAIGVSTQANLTLLDEIAALGGTVEARQVNDAASLRNALTAVLEDLNTCTCAPSSAWCSGGNLSACRPDGSGVESEQACLSGTCADGTSCEAITCYELCDMADAPTTTKLALNCLADAVHRAANSPVCVEIYPGDLAGGHCEECFAGLPCDALARECL